MERADIALIDADGIIFPIGFVAASAHLSLEECFNNLDKRLLDIREQPIAEEAVFYYYCTAQSEGLGKYRDQFAGSIEYKATRKAAALRPKYIDEMFQYLLQHNPTTTVKVDARWGEADDMVSAAAYTCRAADVPCVIVSADKDLRQIPGWHLHPKKLELEYVDERVAALNFYQQALTGDAADNIPGIRGVGPVTAVRYLTGSMDQRAIRLSEDAQKRYPGADLHERVMMAYESLIPPAELDMFMTDLFNLLYLRKGKGDWYRGADSMVWPCPFVPDYDLVGLGECPYED